MSFRTIAVFACLALAAGAPILFSKKDEDNSPSTGSAPFSFASSDDATVSANQPPVVLPPVQFNEPLFNVVGDFREIFSFNISPAWIKHRWPRITVCGGEDDLQGFRVALVTGPMQHDIHGSLTYYFDQDDKLQRITFKGWTGNPTRMEQLVVRDFQFARQSSGGLAFFSAKEWGKTKGVLRLDRPAIIDRSLSNQQVTLMLEVNRPGSSYFLSQQTERILSGLR